ncbi:MAG: CDP-glycerol glycerophosphotransferase family protein, partial [Clostridiales bacterium]|nr:CDP-glycerol glycerophosphotransferase family protein [Clostridiales bacterium]
MNYSVNVEEMYLEADRFRIVVRGKMDLVNDLSNPKIILHCSNGIEDRRIPLVIREVKRRSSTGKLEFMGDYVYMIKMLFWKTRESDNDVIMRFNLMYGDYYEENIPVKIKTDIFEQDGKCYECKPEDNQIRFVKLPDCDANLAEYEKKLKPKVKPVINKIYHWISFVIALCLLPWFIIDAIMAALGIVGYAGGAKKTSAGTARKMVGHVNARLKYFSQHTLSVRNAKKTVKKFIEKRNRAYIVSAYDKIVNKGPVKEGRISFISMRRTDLSGNFAFVYDKIKDDKNLDIQMYLDPMPLHKLTRAQMKRFSEMCATSKVIVLDEFTPYVHYMDIRPETKVVQLWHACGAFKTFGFTRLGKPKGSPQKTRNHRNYDYVTVSTKNVKICHSEGFGIPTDNVVPTGIPRTDVFFDDEYRKNTREALFAQYPQLKGKKVVLFAPTFRGDVKETAYYPMDMFAVDKFMDALGKDYFLIIKHHPFVTEQQPIPEAYSDRVMDLSEQTELNDLLFITDIIITDYSSLVFEASLLKIPMLFYTFDLEDYISKRDFYFNFETFVPGKFYRTQEELQRAIKKGDLAEEKLDAFAK